MPHACVVGAGIGGLAAALALTRVGWQVTVLEQAPALRPVGAGLSLWPNGVRALDALGCGPAVRDAGAPVSDARVGRRDGRPLAVSDPGSYPARYGAPLLGIHRAELHAVLHAALGDRAVVELGRPVASPADLGGTGADLVVAADGIDSRLRTSVVGPGFASVPAGYVAWRGVVEAPESCRGRSGAEERWGAGERFGWLPLSGDRVYWFATATAAPGGRSPDGERAEVARRFSDWAEPVPSLVHATAERSVLRNDVRELRPDLPTFASHQVALVGDAAHAMTPDLGQGAAQALLDAVCLGEALRDAAGRDVPRALRWYDERRRRRAQAVARRSRRVGALAQSRGLAATLRDLLARSTPSWVAARSLRLVVST